MTSLKYLNLWNIFLVPVSLFLLKLQIFVGCEEFENHHHRQKRFLFFNTDNPIRMGVAIYVPMSFALPTWNKNSARRLRREAYIQDYECNMTAEDILPIDSYDDSAYIEELNKVSAYFSLLEVNQDICQRRLLCEVFTNPQQFSPLSDLLMRKLTVDHGMVAENSSSRYYRYIQAMQNGIQGGDLEKCHKLYSKCPYSSQDRFHIESMRFWTFLTNHFGMKLYDG